MQLRYVYSACVVIDTASVRIVCDPWFTPGAYDGSWYQYPPLARDPLDVVGPADLVYVSHIHPDHYDPRFLRRYLDRHPRARIVIGATQPPFLLQKMRADGFSPDVVTRERIGETSIAIVPCNGYELNNVDTALVVAHGDHSVVNLNDNPYDEQQVQQLLELCPGGRPTVALLPYAGAGPYPQTYAFDSEDARQAAAGRKREQFLRGYERYVDRLRPERAIPFAGQYWLGGRLAALNEMRGVPDATEAAHRRPDVSIVLADGGGASLDLGTLQPTDTRTEPYAPEAVASHLAAACTSGYDYEIELQPLHGRRLPVAALSRSAYAHAMSKRALPEPWFVCIRPFGHDQFITLDLSGREGWSMRTSVDALQPRCEIELDERYLFGLFTRLYHWNNAEIGSHYRCRRVPDEFRREVYAFLAFLHV